MWGIPGNEMTQIEQIIGKIKAWDHKDALCLREMISEARALGEDVRNHMSNLPSETIPMEYKSDTFPVWSLDQSGLCITGEQMEKLTHIGVLRFIHEQKEKE